MATGEASSRRGTIEAAEPTGKAPAPVPSARAWSALLSGYLVATLPLAAFGPWDGAARGVWLAGHAAALVWAGRLFRRYGSRHRGPTAGDWTLLALLPLLYAELPLLMEALPGPVLYRDSAVSALEGALFGGQPAFEWAPALPVSWLSETLHLGYLSYYLLIYLPPALLWLGLTGPGADVAEGDAGQGSGSAPSGGGTATAGPTAPRGARRAEAFHQTVLAVGAAMLLAYAVMIVWPVQGPRYLGTPEGVPGGPVRSVVLAILETGSSRGAAFPSSHVSVAVAQTILALRWQPRVGAVVAVATVLLGVGAVYGGFHYLLDVLVGAALGLAAAAVVVAGTQGPGVEGGPGTRWEAAAGAGNPAP